MNVTAPKGCDWTSVNNKEQQQQIEQSTANAQQQQKQVNQQQAQIKQQQTQIKRQQNEIDALKELLCQDQPQARSANRS